MTVSEQGMWLRIAELEPLDIGDYVGNFILSWGPPAPYLAVYLVVLEGLYGAGDQSGSDVCRHVL